MCPIWDSTKNKQANTTQKWQLDCFYEIGATIDLKRVCENSITQNDGFKKHQ